MRIKFFGLLAILLALTAISAQAYQLTFQDVAGTTHNYSTTMTLKGNTDGSGLSMPFTSAITFTATETVTAAATPAAGAALSFAMPEADGNKMSIKYTLPIADDQGKPTEQSIEQKLPAFAMNYTRSPRGKISNLKMSGNTASLFGSGADTSLQGQTGLPGQGLEFPARDLSVGDTWNGQQTIDMGNGNKMNFTATYTLTGTQVVNGISLVVIKSDFTVTTPNLNIAKTGNATTDATTQGLTTSMTMKGVENCLFDPAHGAIYSSTTKGNIEVTVGKSDAGAAAGDASPVKFTMTLDSTTTRTK